MDLEPEELILLPVPDEERSFFRTRVELAVEGGLVSLVATGDSGEPFLTADESSVSLPRRGKTIRRADLCCLVDLSMQKYENRYGRRSSWYVSRQVQLVVAREGCPEALLVVHEPKPSDIGYDLAEALGVPYRRRGIMED